MEPRAVPHPRFERVLVRLRPDPNQPHSTTAPRPKIAELRKGWISLRDADNVLVGIVTTSGRGLRLLDVSLPDTVVLGLVGRTIGDVIDHPALDHAAVIRASYKVDPKDRNSDDPFLSQPWFAVETKSAMIHLDGMGLAPARRRKRSKE